MTAQHAAAAAAVAVACVLCMHVRAVHATCSITATIYHQLNAADMSQPQQQRHYINCRHPRHAALQPLSAKRTAEAPTIIAPNYIFSDGRYVSTAHSGQSTCSRDLDTPSHADG